MEEISDDFFNITELRLTYAVAPRIVGATGSIIIFLRRWYCAGIAQ